MMAGSRVSLQDNGVLKVSLEHHAGELNRSEALLLIQQLNWALGMLGDGSYCAFMQTMGQGHIGKK